MCPHRGTPPRSSSDTATGPRSKTCSSHDRHPAPPADLPTRTPGPPRRRARPANATGYPFLAEVFARPHSPQRSEQAKLSQNTAETRSPEATLGSSAHPKSAARPQQINVSRWRSTHLLLAESGQRGCQMILPPPAASKYSRGGDSAVAEFDSRAVRSRQGSPLVELGAPKAVPR